MCVEKGGEYRVEVRTTALFMLVRWQADYITAGTGRSGHFPNVGGGKMEGGRIIKKEKNWGLEQVRC